MSKLRELQETMGAGARNNKYRVLVPYFSREIDIQVHSVTAPGRSIGEVEVFLKGRKYKLAGDRSDEGTLTMTFYNDEELMIRRFFLQIIAGIQNYATPGTIDESQQFRGDFSDLSSVNATVSNGNLLRNTALGGLFETGFKLYNAYKEIRHNIASIKTSWNHLKSDFEDGGILGIITKDGRGGYGMYNGSPWYMSDIRIQQLDGDGKVVTETILHNAFVTSVEGIEYTDELGEITSTPLNISYSGVTYGTDRENKMILNQY